ncbi:protealysin inhibitor emfourin [Streptomyces gobiensis]|uniref:protealysin inhibitor emfourin n=1 Tax=Streptomyces gobiensis TaxID=2875706 RepID=UPI001E2BBE4A|nr:protealysin inhibitor emfourin [Streptomyces gobiensis]UGY91357.1 hypothetical protein test1122_06230 [Streptomyces gobiensis]
MRITVIRTGGFGGLARRATLETTDPELVDLAHKALAEGRDVRPIGVPDGFSYEIIVDDRPVYCADPHLTEAESALITRVLKEGE